MTCETSWMLAQFHWFCKMLWALIEWTWVSNYGDRSGTHVNAVAPVLFQLADINNNDAFELQLADLGYQIMDQLPCIAEKSESQYQVKDFLISKLQDSKEALARFSAQPVRSLWLCSVERSSWPGSTVQPAVIMDISSAVRVYYYVTRSDLVYYVSYLDFSLESTGFLTQQLKSDIWSVSIAVQGNRGITVTGCGWSCSNLRNAQYRFWTWKPGEYCFIWDFTWCLFMIRTCLLPLVNTPTWPLQWSDFSRISRSIWRGRCKNGWDGQGAVWGDCGTRAGVRGSAQLQPCCSGPLAQWSWCWSW